MFGFGITTICYNGWCLTQIFTSVLLSHFIAFLSYGGIRINKLRHRVNSSAAIRLPTDWCKESTINTATKYHNCSTANTQHFEYKKTPLYFKAQHLNNVFVHKHIFIQPDIGYTWKRKSKSKRTTSLCGANDMTVLNQLQIPTWQLSTLAAVGGLSIITCYDWPEEFFFSFLLK